MVQCYFCETEMKWNSDSDFEDCGIEGEGLIITLICPNCDATAEFYTKIKEDNK